METASGIYVYCIIDSNILESGLNLKGIGGCEVFLLPLNNMGIVAGSFRVQKESNENYIKECAMQHEKITESLMERYTVLPVKFHTVFKDKLDAISSFQKLYPELEVNVKKLNNKVEYGLKVIWHEAEKEENINLPPPVNSILNGDTDSKNYLKFIYGKYKKKELLRELAKVRADEINKYFDNLIVEKKICILQTDNLFLNAAYLVNKEDKNKFIQAFDGLKKNMADKYEFLFTGPWPAYNFIKLKR